MIAVSFLLVTIGVVLLTWFLVKDKGNSTSEDYFLAGRQLTAFPIAMSIFMTNLSANQLVGLAGQAYGKANLQGIAWDIGLVIPFVMIMYLLLPKYLKQGVYTTIDYIEVRYDKTTKLLAAWIFLVSGIFSLGTVLYSGSTALTYLFEIDSLFPNINSKILVLIVGVILAIVGYAYAVFGGLRGVVVSDTIYGILGGVLVVVSIFFAFSALGKGSASEGIKIITTINTHKLNSIGQLNEAWPWPTVITGMLIIHSYYWGFQQTIIQRAFAAKNLAEAQKGLVITGYLKMLVPFLMFIPGVIGYHYFQGKTFSSNDLVYGMLIRETLPVALIGTFAAAVFGAIISSLNSWVGSLGTSFAMNVYKKDHHTKEQLANVGRISSIFFGMGGLLILPIVQNFGGGVFLFIQKVFGYFQPPLFIALIMGVVHKRMPSIAAKIGIGFYIFTYVLCIDVLKIKMHYLYIMTGVTILTILLMYVIATIKPLEKDFILPDKKIVDTTRNWEYLGEASAVMFFIMCFLFLLFSPIGIAAPLGNQFNGTFKLLLAALALFTLTVIFVIRRRKERTTELQEESVISN